MQVTFFDPLKGNTHTADIRVIAERDGAIIGEATVKFEGTTFYFPVVLHEDGVLITAKDWQAPNLDDEQILEEASNPIWAHHWVGPDHEPCVILDGLPRIF